MSNRLYIEQLKADIASLESRLLSAYTTIAEIQCEARNIRKELERELRVVVHEKKQPR